MRNSYAANVLPIIREIQRAGATSLRAIADALNARGVATARGGRGAPDREQHPCTRVGRPLNRQIARHRRGAASDQDIQARSRQAAT
jgi:hypothetical protein